MILIMYVFGFVLSSVCWLHLSINM